MTAPHPEPSETVRERPILFSGAMVSALLDGSKTQTRRVMKPQPPEEAGSLDVGAYHPTIIVRGEEEPGAETFGASTWDGEWAAKCPYGQPGDRLWVRETWGWQVRGGGPLDDEPESRDLVYRADHPTLQLDRWRPSIHMPRAASRITLEITAVRVERVQDITHADALAEGVMSLEDTVIQDVARACAAVGRTECGAVDYFERLWDWINLPRGYRWSTNPWVWVVEFLAVGPT